MLGFGTPRVRQARVRHTLSYLPPTRATYMSACAASTSRRLRESTPAARRNASRPDTTSRRVGGGGGGEGSGGVEEREEGEEVGEEGDGEEDEEEEEGVVLCRMAVPLVRRLDGAPNTWSQYTQGMPWAGRGEGRVGVCELQSRIGVSLILTGKGMRVTGVMCCEVEAQGLQALIHTHPGAS